MSEAKRIKAHYIRPPLIMVEKFDCRTGNASCLNGSFEIKTYIWVDQHLPEYRVAIAENMAYRKEQLEHWDSVKPVETRFITYVPTGRVVYDNTLPPAKAVVYEYILESLLGKKDLKHG